MNGEYVFIIASQLPSNNVKQVWRDYKSEEGGMLDSSLYENVLQVKYISFYSISDMFGI